MTPAPFWSVHRFSPVHGDDDTAPFFEAAARSRLALPVCANGHWLAPEVRRCWLCGATERHWSDTSGRASLVSWTVIHSHPSASGTASPLATVAIVETEEGPWLAAPLRVIEGEVLRSGLPLLVDFDSGGDETIPFFFVAH